MRMKDILGRLDETRRLWLGEVVRFGIVGITATLIQYLVYWICLHWLSPWLSLTGGYIVSFLYNFYASTHFTFRVAANVRHGVGFLLFSNMSTFSRRFRTITGTFSSADSMSRASTR